MPKTRRKQILIVDPDPASATRLRGVLDGLGYRGVTASPVEALAVARGLRLHLALLDSTAAGPDLDHLAGQLRRAAIPVVVLHPEDTAPPTIPGATGYLKQPWRTSDLVHLLYRFVGAPQ